LRLKNNFATRQKSEESFREAEASASEAEASARLNCAPAARQFRKKFAPAHAGHVLEKYEKTHYGILLHFTARSWDVRQKVIMTERQAGAHASHSVIFCFADSVSNLLTSSAK
jgi:hypothetical protein